MKKNDSSAFCCRNLEHNIKEKDIPILYSSKFRSFSVRILDGGSSVLNIKYCPWCGIKFPENLRDIFFDELSKCLNKDAGIEDIDTAPDEFKTDEWWKKRKL